MNNGVRLNAEQSGQSARAAKRGNDFAGGHGLKSSGYLPLSQAEYLPGDSDMHPGYARRMSRQARGPGLTRIQAEIGQRMRWARELVEPNRAAFARDCGVHPTTLVKMEDGDRAPTIFVLRDYCFRLRVSADFLLFGKLGQGDRELEALLIAHHPELVLSNGGKGTPETDTDPASGTGLGTKRLRRPKA